MSTRRSNGSIGVLLGRDLPRSQVVPFAQRAEHLGFDEVWVVEDLGFRGGIAQASALLASTSTITVGIGLLPAGARNAVYAAMEIATLAELFPGRITVAIGHGMPAWTRAVGAHVASPLTLLEEYTSAVRSLLRGERVDTAGSARYVRIDDVALETATIPDVVPDVLLGVRGPRSLSLSGRVADGTVLAEPAGPEYLRASIAHIAPTRPHQVIAYNLASVGSDTSAALAAARPALEWLGESDWSAHLAPLPFADEFAALRADSGSRAEFAQRLPAEWVRQLAIVGTPGDAAARIDQLFAAGSTASILAVTGDEPLTALESLAPVLQIAV